MKVITLKQPWASLIAEGIKKYEFRSWKTNYRGKILIHAGVGIDKDAMNKYKELHLEYPSKQIIAEAEIVDCLKLNDELNDRIIEEKNIAYGSKRRSGYVWKLDNIKKINSNDVVNGQLGLWNYDLKK
jgi:hypothetical protein